MNLINWLKRLLDGDDDKDEITPPAGQQEAPPGRNAEAFLVSVARVIEAEMLRERFTPPGGQVYLPRHYLLFLSPKEKRKWYGERREGMQAWLASTLSERIKRLSQDRISSCTLEILTDSTLEEEQFRVQPLWGTTQSGEREPLVEGKAEGSTVQQTNLRALTSR